MKKYILTSTSWQGFFVYGFTEEGYLYSFERCAYQMKETDIRFMLEQLAHCLHLHDFVQWYSHQGYTVIKGVEDLSFDRFWKDYDNPRNRFECVPLWDKAKQAERLYMIQNIKALRYYMRVNSTWYNQPLPASYLRENWRDEWFKVQHAKPKQ